MLQLAARCRAAVPLAASDPIQASEARAPLAESRGVCAALWTRIGFDVSEAVPLTAPSITAAQADETRSMCGFARFGSAQSRPTSALGLGLGLPVGQRTRAKRGPTVLRWIPRGDGASRSVSRGGTFLVAGEGCPGCPCNWYRRAARPDSGGLCPLGMAPGRRARCQFGPAPTSRLRPGWEARRGS
jgi:hypothetical protein